MSGDIRTIRAAELPWYLGDGGRRTRVLLDPATGHAGLEMYEVELPAGASSEWHARHHPEAIVVTEGTVGVETRSGLHSATRGSVLLIPADVEHRHTCDPRGVCRFLGIFVPPSGHAAEVRKRPTAPAS